MMRNVGEEIADGRDGLRLDRQLCFPLYAASNLLTRLYRPILDSLGLTYPQYLVMLVLWEKSPRSVGEIGEELFLDSGTLTPLLKRMEASGLVERRRDTEDERRVFILLADRGDCLRDQAAKVPETVGQQIGIPLCDAEILRDLTCRLVTALRSSPG